MSDSSNKLDNKVNFDPNKFITELPFVTKVKISQYGVIEFSKGWSKIVESFLHSVKNYSIDITHLQDTFGQLEVIFSVREKTMEVRVWRNIQRLRIASTTTCTKCGEFGIRHSHGGRITVLCKPCIVEAEKNGETGTWLDKY